MKLKQAFNLSLKEKLIVLFLTCIIKDVFGEISWPSKSSLCSFCGNTTTKFLEKFCSPHSAGLHTKSRCCLDRSNKTVGVDLGNCKITKLPPLNSNRDLLWINLASNPKLNCNGGNFTNMFEGFKNLNMIILPSKCHNCPGGNLLWSHHQQTHDSSLNCTGQLNTCTALNRTCPTHSDCHNNGPGFYECLCSGGYHGYKCLIVDGMPLVLALCVIGGATIAIIVPVWFLIWRRKRVHRSGYIIVE